MLFALLQSGGNPLTIVITIFSYLVIILIAFPIHESSHALMAKILGDNTAANQGRISLNPLKHLDPLGTIGMLVFGVGWAKPVMVQPHKARKVPMRAAMALTAAAGPVSNVIVSLVVLVIEKILLVTADPTDATILYIAIALEMIISINLFLAAFNLLPVPPFDGSRIFLSFLPNKLYFGIMKYEEIIKFAILALMLSGKLSLPFQWLADLIYSGLDAITSFIC
ncbi:MAG: site-2 protease family protein [Oscillospiraceae bacterium]|nr:site-2 protease family protein [Oscillospiraceae bacterium]